MNNKFVIADGRLVKYIGEDEEVVIPSTVKVVGPRAFSSNKKLKKVAVPSTVKEIGVCAFSGCSSLRDVTLSEGLEKIMMGAFWFCKSLEKIVIPSSVRQIECENFQYCTSLKTVIILAQIKTLEHYMFGNCFSLETVVLPDGLESICHNVFYNCNKLKSLTLPASITKMSLRAFDMGLDAVTFKGAPPNNMQAFGKSLCSRSMIKVVYAPNASVTQFSLLKEEYLIGFFQLLEQGEAISDTIIEKNHEYIKRNALKLCKTENNWQFAYMLKHKLIPFADVDEAISLLNDGRHPERVAALVEYAQQFTEKERERLLNKKFGLR